MRCESLLLDTVTRGVKGGDQESEAGNGDGEGVDVHAVDAVESLPDEFTSAQVRATALPALMETVVAPSRKCPRAAGGVDDGEAL